MADIYEHHKRSFPWGFVWYALWTIVVIVFMCVLIWVAFIKKSSTSPKLPIASSQTQKKTSTNVTKKANPVPAPNQSSSTTSTTTSATDTMAPTQLADTGPGNLVIPASVTAVVGSAIYYIRLRRRVIQS